MQNKVGGGQYNWAELNIFLAILLSKEKGRRKGTTKYNDKSTQMFLKSRSNVIDGTRTEIENMRNANHPETGEQERA